MKKKLLRIMIPIADTELAALYEIAEEEHRDVRQQIRHLVHCELEKRHLLAAIQSHIDPIMSDGDKL